MTPEDFQVTLSCNKKQGVVMHYYDKETQSKLLKRWREDGDTHSLNLLMRSNQRMIAGMAHKIRGANRGVEIEDLIQEGFLGMMRAAETYDFSSAASFSTYASYSVRNRINRYIMANKGMMKIGTTKDCRTLYQKYPPLSRKLDQLDISEEEKCKIIAKKLDVKLSSVYKFKNIVCKASKSLDDVVGENMTAGGLVPSDVDLQGDAEISDSKSKFFEIVQDMRENSLSDLEIAILDHRYLNESEFLTYDDLAKKTGFSRPTVFNAEKKLLTKIRSRVKSDLKSEKEDFGL